MGKKIAVVLIGSHAKHSFVLEQGQKYVIAPVGYVNPNNPLTDSTFKPTDTSKIKIVQVGEPAAGKTTYSVDNDSDTAINIEIYSDN